MRWPRWLRQVVAVYVAIAGALAIVWIATLTLGPLVAWISLTAFSLLVGYVAVEFVSHVIPLSPNAAGLLIVLIAGYVGLTMKRRRE